MSTSVGSDIFAFLAILLIGLLVLLLLRHFLPLRSTPAFVLVPIFLALFLPYIDSGYRTPRDRFIYSLRSNGRYQLIVLGCGIAGLVYVFLQNGFEGTSVKALVMA
ncbi:MAG: hypothetical protein L6R38_002456 [Xanthoria sp. 2 TBL-2021]|nr:MAG: hypothetical protein L6R38_002456 [Xanthoria sp. 2 TBL-2021]